MIELALESVYQTVFNDIVYSKAISIHRDTSILM